MGALHGQKGRDFPLPMGLLSILPISALDHCIAVGLHLAAKQGVLFLIGLVGVLARLGVIHAE